MKKSRIFTLFGFFLLTAGGCKSGDDSFSDVLGGSGGTGSVGVTIDSSLPGSSSLAIKVTDYEDFIVSARGGGALTYAWTVDGVAVGSNAATYRMNGPDWPVIASFRILKVVVSDAHGSVARQWMVKVNGSPVQSGRTPTAAVYQHRRETTLNFSVSYSDPNSDSLTYTWKLDGQEGVLSSSGATASYSPAAVEVGTHVVSVDVRDGAVSDTGTYTVTQSWTVVVNHFDAACNAMENNSETNKTCVHAGIAGIGDGLNPLTAPSSFMIRPTVFKQTAAGDVFIADDGNDVVWFWNRASAPSVAVAGISVPVNTMKVIAGVGARGSGSSGSNLAIRQPLGDNPRGLEWDGSNLYISDTANNRIVRVDSSGVLTPVLTAGCSGPRGIALNGGYLYIACYGSHIVRRMDTTTLASVVFFGVSGVPGSPPDLAESSPTDGTRGRLEGPFGIAIDGANNIYVSEEIGCRVRMVNQSGGALTYYGTYTISNNQQRIVLGAAGAPSCSYAAGEAVALTATADARINRPQHLTLDGNILFVGNNSDNSVTALNLSSAADAVGPVTVPAYQSVRVIGTGTGGYQGEGAPANTTRFDAPQMVLVDSLVAGDLYVADYDNKRLRKIRGSDYRTEIIAGNGSDRTGTAGNGTVEVGDEKYSDPRGMVYDAANRILFVSDFSNDRIRSVNQYGEASQAVGLGTSGAGSEENELPSLVTMNGPRGLALTHASSSFGGHLVWADTSNHRIRIWNRATTQQILFGVTVDAGRVATVGGNGTAGTAVSGSALQAAFNDPRGVAFDGTDLYVADTGNHCIKKISLAGALSAVAGTCGTSGNVDGAVNAGRMSNPEKLVYYSSGASTGLFIADRGNSRVRFHRLAGSGAIAGVAVPLGSANTVFCGGTYHDDAIIPSNSICAAVYDVAVVGNRACFLNHDYHNVRCVDLGTSLITTVLGPLQGIGDTTPTYFPQGSFSSNSQNGVTAAIGTAPPSITDSYGAIAWPITMTAVDSNTLIVGESNAQQRLLRRVKLP